jgi:hypothetical protein
MASTEQILDGIRKGMVPRQVRLFAAQGLLPVSRDDLVRIQIMLSADPDRELAEIATKSVRELDSDVVVEWLKNIELQPIELDLLARVRNEEPIWAAVASHSQVSDETLRMLAQHCTPLVQDIIVTNQVRIFSCLEILEDLRSNSAVSQVVLRRVREFEEEFIEKAAAGAIDTIDSEEIVFTLEPALEELDAIGAQLPAEEELPLPRAHVDAAVNKAVVQAGESAFGRILKMNIKEKILCATKGGREERGILINSRNRLVLAAVLASPKLTDLEIERFAQSKSVSDEVIRIISSNNRWIRKYPVAVALVFNPKTPTQTALRMLTRMNKKDLLKIQRDRNVPDIIRRRARDMAQRLR